MFRCLLCLLLFPVLASAQNDRMWAARDAALRVDSTDRGARTVTLTLDSIEVQARVYANHITATCTFRGSGSRTSVSFYERDGQLHLATMKERSPLYSDLYRFTGYLYQGDSILERDYHRTTRICLGFDFRARTDPHRYNPALDEAFCARFLPLLYRRLRSIRS